MTVETPLQIRLGTTFATEFGFGLDDTLTALSRKHPVAGSVTRKVMTSFEQGIAVVFSEFGAATI